MEAMSDPELEARRARMKELLAIPDRERTDAQWDELNELEIMMAVTKGQLVQRIEQKGGGNQGQHPRHGGNPQHPGGGRKFHNRPPRRRGPPPGR
jgi:hypothetical protein